MNAAVKEHTVPLGDGIAMTVYEVEYIARYGDGIHSPNIWKSYGVFQSKEVAHYVARCIDDGTIVV